MRQLIGKLQKVDYQREHQAVSFICSDSGCSSVGRMVASNSAVRIQSLTNNYIEQCIKKTKIKKRLGLVHLKKLLSWLQPSEENYNLHLCYFSLVCSFVNKATLQQHLKLKLFLTVLMHMEYLCCIAEMFKKVETRQLTVNSTQHHKAYSHQCGFHNRRLCSTTKKFKFSFLCVDTVYCGICRPLRRV